MTREPLQKRLEDVKDNIFYSTGLSDVSVENSCAAIDDALEELKRFERLKERFTQLADLVEDGISDFSTERWFIDNVTKVIRENEEDQL